MVLRCLFVCTYSEIGVNHFLPNVEIKYQFFTNQKCFIITGESLGYLTAFLNSKIFRFAFKEYFPELLGDTRELSKVFFENVTVQPVDSKTSERFENLVQKIYDLKTEHKSTTFFENEIETMLADIYSLTSNDISLLETVVNGVPSREESKIRRSVLVSS